MDVKRDPELDEMDRKLGELFSDPEKAKKAAKIIIGTFPMDWTYTVTCHKCGKPTPTNLQGFENGMVFCDKCVNETPGLC